MRISAALVVLMALASYPLEGRATHEDNPLVYGVAPDQLIYSVAVDQIELRGGVNGLDSVWDLDAQAWIGNNNHNLQFRVKGTPDVHEYEMHALYRRAVAPRWDFKVGLRQDFVPDDDQSWAMVGVEGLTPFFIAMDASLFVDDDGRTAVRFNASYELPFTQQLILSPDFELNHYLRDLSEPGMGSAPSTVEAGLRLRYEFGPRIAPYVGVLWSQTFNENPEPFGLEGGSGSDWRWIVGFKAWF